MNSELRDNKEKKRFEMDFDGNTVFADYRIEKDAIYLNHVEAPVPLRGSGASGKFMLALMQRLAAQKIKVVPVCSYAAAWLSRHPEFST